MYNFLLKQIDVLCPNKRKPKYSNEYYLDAIMYCLKNGISWRGFIQHPLLSNKIPENHYSTISKKFNLWNNNKIFELAFVDPLKKYAKKKVNFGNNSLLIIDSTIVTNLFGIELIGKYYQNKKRSVKISILCNEEKIPYSIKIFPANKHDSKTVYDTFNNILINPKILGKIYMLGDKGYLLNKDNKKHLTCNNIEMITYKRKNQKDKNSEYYNGLLKNHRYKIENVFSLLKSYKRILMRHEKFIKNYEGFIYFACISIVFNKI
jgi:transposase